MISSILIFFDSNFFQSMVTLLVGFVAIYLYLRQRKDTKRAAANSILLEIQHIEKNIGKVKEAVRRENLNDLSVSMMREDAWSKYSHLFSNDFDKDEWEIITNFYQTARSLSEVIRESNNTFKENAKQIRINRQRILADLNKDFLDNLPNPDDLETTLATQNKKVDVFYQLYMQRQEEFAYTPVKYQNDGRKLIEDLQVISITSVGTKFKKIIGQK